MDTSIIKGKILAVVYASVFGVMLAFHLMPEAPRRQEFWGHSCNLPVKEMHGAWGRNDDHDIAAAQDDAICGTYEGEALKEGLSDTRRSVQESALVSWAISVEYTPVQASSSSNQFLSSLCKFSNEDHDLAKENVRRVLQSAFEAGVYLRTLRCIEPSTIVQAQLDIIGERYEKLIQFIAPTDQFNPGPIHGAPDF